MSNETNRKTVVRAFAGVVEQLTFMFAEPLESVAQAPAVHGRCNLVSMRFGGVLKGLLEIAIPEAVCVEMAANMLGLDTTDAKPQQQADDAVREVLNVACGQILTDLAGERPMFTLTVPQTQTLDPAVRVQLLRDPATAAFAISGATVLVRFRLEETT